MRQLNLARDYGDSGTRTLATVRSAVRIARLRDVANRDFTINGGRRGGFSRTAMLKEVWIRLDAI